MNRRRAATVRELIAAPHSIRRRGSLSSAARVRAGRPGAARCPFAERAGSLARWNWTSGCRGTPSGRRSHPCVLFCARRRWLRGRRDDHGHADTGLQDPRTIRADRRAASVAICLSPGCQLSIERRSALPALSMIFFAPRCMARPARRASWIWTSVARWCGVSRAYGHLASSCALRPHVFDRPLCRRVYSRYGLLVTGSHHHRSAAPTDHHGRSTTQEALLLGGSPAAVSPERAREASPLRRTPIRGRSFLLVHGEEGHHRSRARTAGSRQRDWRNWAHKRTTYALSTKGADHGWSTAAARSNGWRRGVFDQSLRFTEALHRRRRRPGRGERQSPAARHRCILSPGRAEAAAGVQAPGRPDPPASSFGDRGSDVGTCTPWPSPARSPHPSWRWCFACGRPAQHEDYHVPQERSWGRGGAGSSPRREGDGAAPPQRSGDGQEANALAAELSSASGGGRPGGRQTNGAPWLTTCA